VGQSRMIAAMRGVLTRLDGRALGRAEGAFQRDGGGPGGGEEREERDGSTHPKKVEGSRRGDKVAGARRAT